MTFLVRYLHSDVIFRCLYNFFITASLMPCSDRGLILYFPFVLPEKAVYFYSRLYN